MSEIEFVAEPPATAGRWDGVYREKMGRFANVLRANPGRWAIYPRVSTNQAARAIASRISRGRSTAFAKGFTAVSRGTSVYVCYTGKADAPEDGSPLTLADDDVWVADDGLVGIRLAHGYLSPDDARDLAATLQRFADQAEAKS